jgi:hypothetical protein
MLALALAATIAAPSSLWWPNLVLRPEPGRAMTNLPYLKLSGGTLTGDLVLSGGVGALQFTSGDSSIVCQSDNDTSACVWGTTDDTNVLAIDSTNGAEKVRIHGTNGQTALYVEQGNLLMGSGVQILLPFSASISQPGDNVVALTENSEDLRLTYATDKITASSNTGVVDFDWAALGTRASTINAVTGADSLTVQDCGRLTTVTAGIDGATITLPEASTVIGCTFTIMYIGADGGALLDVSPLDSDADGIDGQCKAAAGSTVELSGTADADVGFTKATITTGNTMKLTAVGAAQWIMHGVSGICANN